MDRFIARRLKRNARLGTCLATVFLLLAAGAHAAIPPHYAVTPIEGSSFQLPRGINDAGDVAGNDADGPFVWSRELGMTYLPVRPDGGGVARDINDLGQVVGTSWDSQGYEACMWDEQGQLTLLAGMEDVQADAIGINNASQVAGNASQVAGNTWYNEPFFWSAQTGPTYLGSFGGNYGYARAINDAGQVVGWSMTQQGSDHAFLWTHGALVDLGTFGRESWAGDINNWGWIAGGVETAPGQYHACVWTSDGRILDLSLPGDSSSWAGEINDSNEVVGSFRTPTGVSKPFIWTEAAGRVDLGDLVDPEIAVQFESYSYRALDINAAGQIIVNLEEPWSAPQLMVNSDNQLQGMPPAYLLTPLVAGDASEDGVVDIIDLTALAANWGNSPVGWRQGDFDGNGVIDVQDLAAVAANWTFAPAGGPIPEPTAMALLLCGGAALLRRRSAQVVRRESWSNIL